MVLFTLDIEHRALHDGTLAPGAAGREQLRIVLTAEGIGVLLAKAFTGKGLGALPTHKALGVPILAQGGELGIGDGLIAGITQIPRCHRKTLQAEELVVLDLDAAVKAAAAIRAHEAFRMPLCAVTLKLLRRLNNWLFAGCAPRSATARAGRFDAVTYVDLRAPNPASGRRPPCGEC